MDERRGGGRVPVELRAEVRFSSWKVFGFIYLINISRGGMSVELESPPSIGDHLVVRLGLPGIPPIDLDAVVRHTAPVRAAARDGDGPSQQRFQAGVEFLNLDEERRRTIEAMLHANRGLTSTPTRTR